MHTRDITPWLHPHVFDEVDPLAERSTRLVVAVTSVMMVIEILAGWWFGSMALLADGWHMSSHALAVGLSALAYVASRRYARDHRFTWGAWKIEVLAAYTSGLFLVAIALFMTVESAERLLAPEPISFDEAIAVALLGLLVNIGCAVVLGRSHAGASRHGGHGHDHRGDEDRHHEDHVHHVDLNLRSAYLHVVADAMTSVLAVVALAAGKHLGWVRLDPAMGIVGAALVAAWAWGLLRQTGRVLLDAETDEADAGEIRRLLEREAGEATRVADFHLWRVGKGRYACVVGLVTSSEALSPDDVKRLLSRRPELIHVTVEIHRCREA